MRTLDNNGICVAINLLTNSLLYLCYTVDYFVKKSLVLHTFKIYFTIENISTYSLP